MNLFGAIARSIRLKLMLVVLATQLIGDWLRIRLDPQLRNL